MTRFALVGALLPIAGGAWVLTGARMAGMDTSPAADLGDLGWFGVTWIAMMTAMMLPSLGPAALSVARGGTMKVAGFVAAYLAVWLAAGLAAYGGFEALRPLGRPATAAALLAAAAYQLTAAKAGCLERCRTPSRLGGADRSGVGSGLRHGAYCVGCCAGLMAALFALGVMNLAWMAVIAALVAAERLLPWRTPAVYATAATLAVIAIWTVAGQPTTIRLLPSGSRSQKSGGTGSPIRLISASTSTPASLSSAW